MKPIVALSYFHRVKGPLVFYSYPENMLSEEFSARIANIMDQTVSEGFFTHSFEQNTSNNYYFEIHSDWARGNKEMLMVSIIFEQQINSEVEQSINVLCTEFLAKLLSKEEIYTSFYLNDINNYDEHDKDLIYKNNSLIKLWIKELYWAAFENTREKSEEEKKKSGNEGDDDSMGLGFPYIFTPPKPPDDFAMAPQVKVRDPMKDKDPKDEVHCQYCGRELTKEEQLTHSCKKKPENNSS